MQRSIASRYAAVPATLLFGVLGVLVVSGCAQDREVPAGLMNPREARTAMFDVLYELIEPSDVVYDWSVAVDATDKWDYRACDGFFGSGTDYQRNFAIDVAAGEGMARYRAMIQQLDAMSGWSVGWSDDDDPRARVDELHQTQLVHDDIGGIKVSWWPKGLGPGSERIGFWLQSHCYPNDPETGAEAVEVHEFEDRQSDPDFVHGDGSAGPGGPSGLRGGSGIGSGG